MCEKNGFGTLEVSAEDKARGVVAYGTAAASDSLFLPKKAAPDWTGVGCGKCY